MLKKAFLLSVIILSAFLCKAQTTFLPLGSEDYHILDRTETLTGRLCDTICLGDQGESRRTAICFLENLQRHLEDTNTSTPSLKNRFSSIDRYNIAQMISENSEWTTSEEGAIDSKKAWFNTFYKKQYDLVYKKGYFLFLVLNPIINGTVLAQQNTPAVDPATNNSIPRLVIGNSRGIEVRGWVSKKVGFYTSFTDNQEQYPFSVNNFAGKRFQAVPGADYFLKPAAQFGYYDYLQTNGYVNFDLVKNHINTTFGFGKNFIGDGISSLFLTDYSSAMPYLKIQTRIWNLNYECLFMELTPQFIKGEDTIFTHKYSAIHYLTWNVTKSFLLGLFESEVFDRTDGYELSYMNPIILTTAINRFNGSGDKSMLGMNAKKILGHHFQLYGQFVFNEFRYKELISNRGWYGNKWGIQAGAKYFDAFGIRNLDLQGEVMAVRPYTYAAQDTLANYTNYNQPLADPLGSGFVKATGIIRYSPVKNFYIDAQATYYVRGNDTGSLNYGNDVFKAYPTAVEVYGVKLINGPQTTCEMMSLNLSYQVRRNVFLDLGGVYRNYVSTTGVYPVSSTTGVVSGPQNTTYVYFGVRMNTPRRRFDFF